MHTKGPWKVWYRTTMHLPYQYQVSDVQESEEEAAANARLIESALELADMPDTLCAGLAWNIENHPDIMNESDNEALAAAQALLARVREE